MRHRQELHRNRLKNAKSTIDRSLPKGFGKVRRNLKREQQLEDRYAQIEHENRLLLARMTEIMQKSTVDNRSEAWKHGRSLNLGSRKRQLAKIAQENEKILERIRNVKPSYNHLKWEEEAMEAEKLVESITEFKQRPIGQSTSLLRRSRIENASPSNSPGKRLYDHSVYSNMDGQSIDALNSHMSGREYHDTSMSYNPSAGHGQYPGPYSQYSHPAHMHSNPYVSYENVHPSGPGHNAYPQPSYSYGGHPSHTAQGYGQGSHMFPPVSGSSTSLPPVAGVHGTQSGPQTSLLGSIPYGYGHVPPGGAGVPSMYAPSQANAQGMGNHNAGGSGGGMGLYTNPSSHGSFSAGSVPNTGNSGLGGSSSTQSRPFLSADAASRYTATNRGNPPRQGTSGPVLYPAPKSM